MTTKERIVYNQLLAERIKGVLLLEESFVYEHNMIFKDCYGNLVKIEFVHYKNEEGYKAHQANEEWRKEYRAQRAENIERRGQNK
jgi:hypothetical protein